MKSALTPGLLLALLGSSLLPGCSKQDAAAPVPTPARSDAGSLGGTVSPAGSILEVTAQPGSGPAVSTSPTRDLGEFKLSALPAGQYTLSFKPANGYLAPASRPVRVAAGQHTDAGPVQVATDGRPRSGTMSWTVGGQVYNATITGGTVDRQGGQFSLTGRAPGDNRTDEVTLTNGSNNRFTGAGTYRLGLATYRLTTGTTTTYNDRTTNGPLVVTQYDETTRTATGTFSFTGMTGDLGGDVITVTNGTFSVRF